MMRGRDYEAAGIRLSAQGERRLRRKAKAALPFPFRHPARGRLVLFREASTNRPCLDAFLTLLAIAIRKETGKSCCVLKLDERGEAHRIRSTGGTKLPFSAKLPDRLKIAARAFSLVLVAAPAKALRHVLAARIRPDETYWLFDGDQPPAASNLPSGGKGSPNFIVVHHRKPDGEFVSRLRRLSPGANVRSIAARPEALNLPELPNRRSVARRRFGGQFRSLARELTGRRIGLALSCGGAKGLAHVGVLETLEALGIEPDVVAGSSMGAYVAALYAKGYDAAAIKRFALAHRGALGALRLADPSLWPIRGLVKGGRIERELRHRLSGASFEELSLPVLVSGTHMDNLEAEWFRSGDLASAVRASCSLPGIFSPASRGGEYYVDGGIAAPLPVEKLKDLGIEKVIASNVLVPPHRFPELAERENARRARCARRQPILSALHRLLNPFAFGNAPHVLDRCVQVGQARELARNLKLADVVVNAYSFRSRWYEFHKPERFIALGRKVARSQAQALLATARKQPPNPSEVT